ncbi:MAG: AAA-like domain-containing protein, partial [Microcystis sp.]
HWDNLQKQPELLTAMGEVVNSSDKGVRLEPITAYKLESMGLIQLKGDLAQPSCQLYQLYFREEQTGSDL